MPQREIRWSIPVAVSDIPAEGRQFDISASEGERADVARSLDLPAVSRLDLHLQVRRTAADGLHVAGTVSATVTQTCVVTLEPVVNDVEETVDLAFSPRAADSATDADVEASFEAPDPPESMPEGRVDLAAIAVEFLQLGLDPYPRKPDAVFEPPATEARAEDPFAALGALKERGRQQG